jgi:hypothetical protein
VQVRHPVALCVRSKSMTQRFDRNNRPPSGRSIPNRAGTAHSPWQSGKAGLAVMALCLLVAFGVVAITTLASNSWFSVSGRTLLDSPLGTIAPPRTLQTSGNAGSLILDSALGDLAAQENLTLPFDPGTAHLRLEIVPWAYAGSTPEQGCRGVIRATCSTGVAIGEAWVAVQWSAQVPTTPDQMRALAQTLVSRWQQRAALETPLTRPAG